MRLDRLGARAQAGAVSASRDELDDALRILGDDWLKAYPPGEGTMPARSAVIAGRTVRSLDGLSAPPSLLVRLMAEVDRRHCEGTVVQERAHGLNRFPGISSELCRAVAKYVNTRGS